MLYIFMILPPHNKDGVPQEHERNMKTESDESNFQIYYVLTFTYDIACLLLLNLLLSQQGVLDYKISSVDDIQYGGIVGKMEQTYAEVVYRRFSHVVVTSARILAT